MLALNTQSPLDPRDEFGCALLAIGAMIALHGSALIT